MSSEQERNETVLREFVRLIDEGKLDAAFEKVADTVLVHAGGDPVNRDKAYWKVVEGAFLNSFSNGKHEFKHVATAGELVSANLIYTGTHTGQLMGLPATHKAVRIPLMLWVQVRNGQITECWFINDTLQLFTQQLGALPSAALGIAPAA